MRSHPPVETVNLRGKRPFAIEEVLKRIRSAIDEFSGPAALRLFESARTPQRMLKLSETEI